MFSRRWVLTLVLAVMALVASACSDDATSTVAVPEAQSADATLEDFEQLMSGFLLQSRVDVDLEVNRQFPEPDLDVNPIVAVEHRFRWDDAGAQGIGRTQIDSGAIVAAVDFRVLDDTVWQVTTPVVDPQWLGRPFSDPVEELRGIGPYDARLVLAAIIDSIVDVRSVAPRGAGGSVWDFTVDATSLASVGLPPDDTGEQLALAPDVEAVLEFEVDRFGQPVEARADLDVWWTAAMLNRNPDIDFDNTLRMQFRAAFAAGEPALSVESPCVELSDPNELSCPFDGPLN